MLNISFTSSCYRLSIIQEFNLRHRWRFEEYAQKINLCLAVFHISLALRDKVKDTLTSIRILIKIS